MTVALYGKQGVIPLPQEEPPLTHDLNAGESWFLSYPDINAYRPERGYWAVWNRHTGGIIAIAYPEPNQHGWDHMKYRIRDYSQPPLSGRHFNPFELDAVP